MWVVQDVYESYGNEPCAIVLVGPFETQQAAAEYMEAMPDDEDRVDAEVLYINSPAVHTEMMADAAAHREAADG